MITIPYCPTKDVCIWYWSVGWGWLPGVWGRVQFLFKILLTSKDIYFRRSTSKEFSFQTKKIYCISLKEKEQSRLPAIYFKVIIMNRRYRIWIGGLVCGKIKKKVMNVREEIKVGGVGTKTAWLRVSSRCHCKEGRPASLAALTLSVSFTKI